MSTNELVGIGLSNPTFPLEVQTAGLNALAVLRRTDGAQGILSAGGVVFSIGSTTAHPTQFLAGGAWQMKLHVDGSLEMKNGAMCTVDGMWINNTLAVRQQNVRTLTTEEALAALEGLEPVRFQFLANPAEEHVGFTSEDVPTLLLSADGKGVNAMDVAAVLTKVVQRQEARIAELEGVNAALAEALLDLRARVDQLELVVAR